MSDIRLGCIHCDRDDFDFISDGLLASAPLLGWEDIQAVEPSASVLDWETHLGTCPRCVTAERLRMLNHPNEEVRQHWRAKIADQQEPPHAE